MAVIPTRRYWSYTRFSHGGAISIFVQDDQTYIVSGALPRFAGECTDCCGARLRMADLLDGLETGLRFAVGASGRLRSHVDRIDQFIIESGTTPLHQEMSFDGGLPISQSAYDNVPQQHPLIPRLPTQVPQRQRPISLASPLPSYDSRMPPPLDTSLPWEMTSNWPWPFDPDEELLFPDILSGWSH